jgi:hypothetical protein
LLFTIVVRRLVSGDQPTPGAERAKEYRIEMAGCPCTVIADRSGGVGVLLNKIRLSATDISALASMKNVAKCDTWCELQNPVNHRVFERKLRPKPLGRGHVCMGVTHRVAPPRSLVGSVHWPPVPHRAAGSKWSPLRRTYDKWWLILRPSRLLCENPLWDLAR